MITRLSEAQQFAPGDAARKAPRSVPELGRWAFSPYQKKGFREVNDSILVAIITVSGGIFAAALTFYLTKRRELEVEWQHEKLNHYKVLLSALSDLATDGTDKSEANMKFALAVNTIALVAPQYVINDLMAFHNEVKFSNPDKSPEKHDKLLVNLLLAIRKDIGLAAKDNKNTFDFHLIGAAPSKNKSHAH